MPKRREDIKDLRQYSRTTRIEEKYDWWDKVMDGGTHELVAGRDFQVLTETLRQGLKSWADRNKVPLVVRSEGDNLLIQLAKPRSPVRRKGGSKR